MVAVLAVVSMAVWTRNLNAQNPVQSCERETERMSGLVPVVLMEVGDSGGWIESQNHRK